MRRQRWKRAAALLILGVEIAEPSLEGQGAEQGQDRNVLPLLRLCHPCAEKSRIHDAQILALKRSFAKHPPLAGKGLYEPAADVGLSFSLQNLPWNNSGERAAHQGAALFRPHELFARNCGAKSHEVAVEKGIAPFIDGLCRERNAGNLPAKSFDSRRKRLHARQRSEEPEWRRGKLQVFTIARPEFR